MLPYLAIGEAVESQRPVIRKLGTLECNLVETTPVVFKDRLYRFEYVHLDHKSNTTGKTFFRFVDVETGEQTPGFAEGYHLGSAYVEGDTMYVYGVEKWGGSVLTVFRSTNLEDWESDIALEIPGWGMYNNSVCKGKDGYYLAVELGEPPNVVGIRFTMRFAKSRDLINWEVLPSNRVYAQDRYTACPALRFIDDWFYMIYLEELSGPSYKPYIARTQDFRSWESSPLNPMMNFSEEDKRIANPKLTPEEREQIAEAVNINNSDVDLCEFEGRTIIYYSWGNQLGVEFLAEAVYDGPMADLFHAFFPMSQESN